MCIRDSYLGEAEAKKWLNAHESCSVIKTDVAMDHHNNKAGAKLAVKLLKTNDFSRVKLSEACFTALKSKRLKVLWPFTSGSKKQ